MRAASTDALARTGAVRSGSNREPAESGAAIQGGESVRPDTPSQVLPRRGRQIDGCEGSRRSRVGYNPLGRAILDRRNGRFCWCVVLTALAVGAALAVRTAMTAGFPLSRRGLAGRNLTASAAACNRFCLVRASNNSSATARSCWQTLHGDRNGSQPDKYSRGNVLSDPHDERSQMLAAPCLKDLCLKGSVGGSLSRERLKKPDQGQGQSVDFASNDAIFV